MRFTPAQQAAIKTYVLADPVLAPLTSGDGTDYGFVASTLSGYPISPVLAWSTNVPSVVSDDAPSYATFDSIVAGKRDSWGFFLANPRDFTRKKVRDWVVDVWGAATAASNAEAILKAGTENMRVIEVVLGGVDKTTGTVTAKTRSYVGGIDLAEVAGLFNV
jgi:hypothetical protein